MNIRCSVNVIQMIVCSNGCVRLSSLLRSTSSRLIVRDYFFASCSPERRLLRVPLNGTSFNRFKLVSSLSDDDTGKHRVFTVPNALCAFRIGLTPVIGSLVVNGSYQIALSLFVVAAITDMLDGLIARNVRGQKSLLGSVLDPVADKFLVGTLFITCTYASLIPVPLTAVVLTRDVCLVGGGFIKRYQTMQPPITLSRFFDSKVSSMQIVPTIISKMNTVLQLSVVSLALILPIVNCGSQLDLFFSALCMGSGVTTVWSGVQYASGKALKRV